jgi:hypothetical protein
VHQSQQTVPAHAHNTVITRLSHYNKTLDEWTEASDPDLVGDDISDAVERGRVQ